MNKLEVKNLNKKFNESVILKDISFELKKQEILGILGDSGSGKSTLLKCINLLEPSDSGNISIDDQLLSLQSKDLKLLKKIRSKIGLVFQDYNLWPHMSVIENLIEAPLLVNKEPKNIAVERAMAILEKFNIENKALAMPEELSGGQQQRVAIARSLMMKPEIMLFDEPSSSLDPSMVQKLATILKELKNEGITIIFSSHEISFVKNIADIVIFLHNSEITEQGDISILENPQTSELKRFLNYEK